MSSSGDSVRIQQFPRPPVSPAMMVVVGVAIIAVDLWLLLLHLVAASPRHDEIEDDLREKGKERKEIYRVAASHIRNVVVKDGTGTHFIKVKLHSLREARRCRRRHETKASNLTWWAMRNATTNNAAKQRIAVTQLLLCALNSSVVVVMPLLLLLLLEMMMMVKRSQLLRGVRQDWAWCVNRRLQWALSLVPTVSVVKTHFLQHNITPDAVRSVYTTTGAHTDPLSLSLALLWTRLYVVCVCMNMLSSEKWRDDVCTARNWLS